MSDDTPTRKDSGSLDMFAQTCRENLVLLEGLHSLEASGLRVTCNLLLNTFESWKVTPPLAAERVHAVQHLLSLHRSVASLVGK